MNTKFLLPNACLMTLALLAACGGGGGGGGGGGSASSNSPAASSSTSSANSSALSSSSSSVSSATSSAASSSAASSNTSSSSSVASSSAASSNQSSSSSSTASSAVSSSAASSSSSSAITLDQTSNPVYAELNTYKSWLSTASGDAAKLAADKAKADIIISWQMPHGGFYKKPEWYASTWDGSHTRSEWYGASKVELGTIDNDATVSELLFLADVYKRSGDSKYRDSAHKALEFLLTMQYSTGGWPQVYPPRTGTTYSNYVTFNDEAMVRVLITLDHAAKLRAPFDGDVFTTDQRDRINTAIDKGVDFILKAQIVQNGVKTVWCAQHDPSTYVAREARAYELASKSGKESIGIITFLMSRPQTPEIEASVKAALAWFKSDAVKLKDTAYEKVQSKANKTNPFISQAGSTAWCRFYELSSDTCFFSGRLPNASDCTAPAPFSTCRGKQSDIMQIEEERRYGYEWGSSSPLNLFTYSDKVGY